MTSNKKAILIVSFGTLKNAARASCVDEIISKVKRNFPQYEVKNVFTSVFILQKINKEKLDIFSLSETLELLLQDGYEEVIIQPTLLTAGQEYKEKILKVVEKYQDKFPIVKIGPPAILPDKNIDLVMNALDKQIDLIGMDEEIVLMGHGSKNEHNPLYLELQKAVDKICPYISIGVLEEDDYPNFNDVIKRLQQKNRKRVCLMPLLFVAGMHVREDMLGDISTSWKSRLKKAGFVVRYYDKGLGENEVFQEIYLKNIEGMINNKK